MSALKVGQTNVDAAAYALRSGGQTVVGITAEVERRVSEALSVGANAFAEKDIGGQSRLGGSVFGRLRF